MIERIHQFIEKQSISNREFYRRTGLSNSYLSMAKSIGGDKLIKIHSAFPEINMDWVVTGRGEMIYTSVTFKTTNTMEEKKEYLHFGTFLRAYCDYENMGIEDIANNLALPQKDVLEIFRSSFVKMDFIIHLEEELGFKIYRSKPNNYSTGKESDTDTIRGKAVTQYFVDNNISIHTEHEVLPPGSLFYSLDFLEFYMKLHKKGLIKKAA